MKKYITKKNIGILLLFLQFGIISILQTYDLAPDQIQALSLLSLLIGYWINPDENKNNEDE